MAYFLGKGQMTLNQNPYSMTNPQGDTRTLSNQGAPDATATEEGSGDCLSICDERRGNQ